MSASFCSSGLFAGVAALLLAATSPRRRRHGGGPISSNAIAAVFLGITMFEPAGLNIPGRSSRRWC